MDEGFSFFSNTHWVQTTFNKAQKINEVHFIIFFFILSFLHNYHLILLLLKCRCKIFFIVFLKMLILNNFLQMLNIYLSIRNLIIFSYWFYPSVYFILFFNFLSIWIMKYIWKICQKIRFYKKKFLFWNQSIGESSPSPSFHPPKSQSHIFSSLK